MSKEKVRARLVSGPGDGHDEDDVIQKQAGVVSETDLKYGKHS